MHCTADVPPAVARRAVEWLVELQSEDATEATRRGWQHWRDAHPDHERAWRRIEAVNGRLREVASPVGAAVAHATLASRRSVKRRDAIKTLAVLLFAGGTAWVAEERSPWREWVADARTGVGERRTLRLGDGSTVALNTASAVDVHFSGGERRIRLLAGEILVATGSDGAAQTVRPFVVETAQGELHPLGTRFAVRQYDAATRLDVFEGAVCVDPRDGAGRSLRVDVGARVLFTGDHIGTPTAADEAATAWIDGLIVASGMRLADLVAELDRHRPGRLRCDPAVADLRVSGSYPLADIDRLLDTLRATLPVKIHYVTRYWATVRPV